MLANTTKLATAAAVGSTLLFFGAAVAHANNGNPSVSFRQLLSNAGPTLVVDISSNADSDADCTYTADGWYHRSFHLSARGGYNLVVAPAIPKFAPWDIVVSCDNGTETRTSYFY